MDIIKSDINHDSIFENYLKKNIVAEATFSYNGKLFTDFFQDEIVYSYNRYQLVSFKTWKWGNN